MSASNPLYRFQEYLKSINIEGAWNELKTKDPNIEFGSSDIIVGIIDQDGIESESINFKEEAVVSDLKGNVDGKEKFSCFYNFATNTFNIAHNKFRNSAHGTQVAGIISANNNSEGISGVAPNCGLFAIATTIIAFTLFYFVIFKKDVFEPSVKDIVLYVLGVLSAILTQIYSYYFGSSQGSANKHKMIENMQNKNSIK